MKIAERFHIVPMQAALGAEVRGLDLRRLDDDSFKDLHAAWLQNLMLVFRGQSLDAQDLVTLVKRFGTPVTSSGLHKRDLTERSGMGLLNLPPEVTVVSNVKQEVDSQIDESDLAGGLVDGPADIDAAVPPVVGLPHTAVR